MCVYMCVCECVCVCVCSSDPIRCAPSRSLAGSCAKPKRLHPCCLARTHHLPSSLASSASLPARGRPAETLFQPAFYQGLKDAMRPGAIMCNQGECIWLHLDLIGTVLRHCTAARSQQRSLQRAPPWALLGSARARLLRPRRARPAALSSAVLAGGVTPRGSNSQGERPSHRSPSHRLGCSIQPPLQPPISLPVATQAPRQERGQHVHRALRQDVRHAHRLVQDRRMGDAGQGRLRVAQSWRVAREGTEAPHTLKDRLYRQVLH